MTREEYYDICKALWEATNKDCLPDIREYNRLRRDLRRLIEDDDN